MNSRIILSLICIANIFTSTKSMHFIKKGINQTRMMHVRSNHIDTHNHTKNIDSTKFSYKHLKSLENALTSRLCKDSRTQIDTLKKINIVYNLPETIATDQTKRVLLAKICLEGVSEKLEPLFSFPWNKYAHPLHPTIAYKVEKELERRIEGHPMLKSFIIHLIHKNHLNPTHTAYIHLPHIRLVGKDKNITTALAREIAAALKRPTYHIDMTQLTKFSSYFKFREAYDQEIVKAMIETQVCNPALIIDTDNSDGGSVYVSKMWFCDVEVGLVTTPMNDALFIETASKKLPETNVRYFFEYMVDEQKISDSTPKDLFIKAAQRQLGWVYNKCIPTPEYFSSDCDEKIE